MAKLPYRVECKSTLPFFELIAAFDCEPPAQAYARDCVAAHPNFEYRVKKGTKILVNEWDSVK